MAQLVYNAVTNTEALKDLWSPEWGLDPTEETKVSDWVMEPPGIEKIGRVLNLRKLPAFVASTYTPSQTAGLRAGLTWTTGTSASVTATATGRVIAYGVDRSVINRAVDDGNYRAGLRNQAMASLRETSDIALFALGSSVSSTLSQADVDDAMVRAGLGLLATNAKGKFNDDAAKLMVVHASEYANAIGIPTIKEYQIRGNVGSAVTGKLNAYGLVWRESGNVLNSAGSKYNVLLLKDAWVLGWNERPHILDVQPDGLTENFIGYAEFGVAKYFDASGVALITT